MEACGCRHFRCGMFEDAELPETFEPGQCYDDEIPIFVSKMVEYRNSLMIMNHFRDLSQWMWSKPCYFSMYSNFDKSSHLHIYKI